MTIATVGIDLSLASTGLAVAVDGRLVGMKNVKTSGKKGDTYPDHMPRILEVVDRVNTWLADAAAIHGPLNRAVIEAPSYGSKFGNAHERAGVWWRVYEHLWSAEVPITVMAPASRAKYITGNGKADKKEVLLAARERWGEEIPNHDIADAVGMAMWAQEDALG